MALLLLSHPARQLYRTDSLLPLRRTVKVTVFWKVTGPTRCIWTLWECRVEYFLCDCIWKWRLYKELDYEIRNGCLHNTLQFEWGPFV